MADWLEDFTVSNIAMRNIIDVPFFFRLGSRMRGPDGVPVGKLRRVLVNNVVVSGADSKQAALVTGIPGHYIEDIKFAHIYIRHRGGGGEEAASISPPEIENAYPEPNRFGPVPAHGFFIRHARGVSMRDIEIQPLEEDLRPAFVLNDVEGADFAHIKLPRPAEASFVLKSAKDFSVVARRPIPDTHLESAAEKTGLREYFRLVSAMSPAGRKLPSRGFNLIRAAQAKGLAFAGREVHATICKPARGTTTATDGKSFGFNIT